ncbi:hypothetical protein GM3709_1495 [Geminocystis sp. NIES-3709]|nr:hypothetical protein GM3709_1495 [Geminocystis sp. NIES-3709]
MVLNVKGYAWRIAIINSAVLKKFFGEGRREELGEVLINQELNSHINKKYRNTLSREWYQKC